MSSAMTAMTDMTCNTACAPAQTPRPVTGFSVRQSLSVWRERRALRGLDAAQLRDLGLSRRQAHAEAARPIWDVPAYWRR
jgi:uncharacterized protein YjiS (DUF1127 family)